MNANKQSIIMFLIMLAGNLLVIFNGTAPDGTPVDSFSEVTPVQYVVALLTTFTAYGVQYKTAKSDPVR